MQLLQAALPSFTITIWQPLQICSIISIKTHTSFEVSIKIHTSNEIIHTSKSNKKLIFSHLLVLLQIVSTMSMRTMSAPLDYEFPTDTRAKGTAVAIFGSDPRADGMFGSKTFPQLGMMTEYTMNMDYWRLRTLETQWAQKDLIRIQEEARLDKERLRQIEADRTKDRAQLELLQDQLRRLEASKDPRAEEAALESAALADRAETKALEAAHVLRRRADSDAPPPYGGSTSFKAPTPRVAKPIADLIPGLDAFMAGFDATK
jgi:hypothetical protein